MSVSTDNRGQWGSKFGFIMAAAGSAVGLGNIWRFPYITGQYGGGAFVLVYLLCVLLIGVPLLFTEMGFGRFTKKSTIGAFKDTGANPIFMGLGALMAVLVSFFVLSYYGVIAGWTIGYIFKTLAGSTGSFEAFAANAGYTISLMAAFTLVTVLIVLGGVSGGIEKAAKVLMPLLFGLIILIAIRSLLLPGAMAGVDFYLNPDFSKINGNSILAALGQAFFSMSIGWGIMITYGSYLPKSANIVSSGVWVGIMDAGVALLAGFMIFPAVFAFGKSPDQGQALVFHVLPEIFSSMPGGAIIGALFFLLLMVAALTSSISMLEVPASYFMDEKKWSRKKAAWVVGILVFLVGIPSALSNGSSQFFTHIELSLPWLEAPKVGVQNILDYLFGELFIVVVAFTTCTYVAWKMPIKNIVGELDQGSPEFKAGNFASNTFVFFIRYICPIVILLVLLNMFGLFGVFVGA
ncbi:MAG: sodium-dependent transporter [Cyclobacteriaceae bacterium]|nr:sodium-dependent transporter [Cyclobacteriaceae bacterium]MCB0500864.1 sodium-dependent transporter [Cyclobacteriaceae bacterium]MCB9238445.1 sodium-dependent transporter [Flammeovirgaceae bacterium]MCW5903862.1 sodium-dependent transporter [Cyclobacteriaceae bacterium]